MQGRARDVPSGEEGSGYLPVLEPALDQFDPRQHMRWLHGVVPYYGRLVALTVTSGRGANITVSGVVDVAKNLPLADALLTVELPGPEGHVWTTGLDAAIDLDGVKWVSAPCGGVLTSTDPEVQGPEACLFFAPPSSLDFSLVPPPVSSSQVIATRLYQHPRGGVVLATTLADTRVSRVDCLDCSPRIHTELTWCKPDRCNPILADAGGASQLGHAISPVVSFEGDEMFLTEITVDQGLTSVEEAKAAFARGDVTPAYDETLGYNRSHVQSGARTFQFTRPVSLSTSRRNLLSGENGLHHCAVGACPRAAASILDIGAGKVVAPHFNGHALLDASGTAVALAPTDFNAGLGLVASRIGPRTLALLHKDALDNEYQLVGVEPGNSVAPSIAPIEDLSFDDIYGSGAYGTGLRCDDLLKYLLPVSAPGWYNSQGDNELAYLLSTKMNMRILGRRSGERRVTFSIPGGMTATTDDPLRIELLSQPAGMFTGVSTTVLPDGGPNQACVVYPSACPLRGEGRALAGDLCLLQPSPNECQPALDTSVTPDPRSLHFCEDEPSGVRTCVDIDTLDVGPQSCAGRWDDLLPQLRNAVGLRRRDQPDRMGFAGMVAVGAYIDPLFAVIEGPREAPYTLTPQVVDLHLAPVRISNTAAGNVALRQVGAERAVIAGSISLAFNGPCLPNGYCPVAPDGAAVLIAATVDVEIDPRAGIVSSADYAWRSKYDSEFRADVLRPVLTRTSLQRWRAAYSDGQIRVLPRQGSIRVSVPRDGGSDIGPDNFTALANLVYAVLLQPAPGEHIVDHLGGVVAEAIGVHKQFAALTGTISPLVEHRARYFFSSASLAQEGQVALQGVRINGKPWARTHRDLRLPDLSWVELAPDTFLLGAPTRSSDLAVPAMPYADAWPR